MKRSPRTLSRELARDLGCESDYVASLAGEQASQLRFKPRKALKLVVGNPLFLVVKAPLQKNWSPEQIAGTLRLMHPDKPAQRVSHETIYHTLYAMPRGELRRELIAGLRWRRDQRRSKTRAPDGRGHIAQMQSIHLRPPEVADRFIPGHWEADLIKGAMNPTRAMRSGARSGCITKAAIWTGALSMCRHKPSRLLLPRRYRVHRQ